MSVHVCALVYVFVCDICEEHINTDHLVNTNIGNAHDI